MNKQSISFKADEQKLIKTGGIEHYASNIVAYIEATFDLGANWNGYDSVRAVWSNDYLTDISTVLDPNGKCIVPTEVLTDTGNVTVNLVGSIADGDTLTDRLTTCPCKAVIVDADAKVEGEETESITPSQFEQFVEIVHDEVEQVTGMTAEAETLPAGSDATASYNDGVLSFGIPRGDKGDTGEQGETGHTGAPAGFGNVTASVDDTVGTPSVVVNTSGPDTAKEFDFQFHNLKGDKGDTGATGATGNGIASTVLNPDYTLTITFTDGTSYTTPSIRGAKGETGDTGATGATGNGIQSTVLNADYTLTITFTDGTSYTTPSIRGEQGPAGVVQDVTVNGTSVVDSNGVAVITMPELVKTVNGNPIVIDDAFGEVKNLDVELTPIQDLNGYSKPWAGGAGTNKWDEEWESGAVNGASGNTYSDSTRIRSKNFIPVLSDTNYFVKSPAVINYAWYDANKTYISGDNNASPNYTRKSPANAAYLKFCIVATTYNNDIAINYPSTVTTYSPYSNICPITGHDSVTVRDRGRNMLDPSTITVGKYYNQQMTEVTAPTKAHSGIIAVKPSTSYCLNGYAGQSYYSMLALDADQQPIGAWYGGASKTAPFVATTPANAYYMVLNFNADQINTIAFYESATVDGYIEYYGQSKTVTLPHTVYGAGVGVTSGTSKETWKSVDMGTLTWSTSNTGQYYADLGGVSDRTGATVKCSIYESGDAYGLTLDKVICVYGSTGRVFVRDTSYSSKTAFQQAMNGVQLCYELATPTDLTTTPTDLTLYNGDNVVSSDGDMELTYVQDMAIVIRKIESQL